MESIEITIHTLPKFDIPKTVSVGNNKIDICNMKVSTLKEMCKEFTARVLEFGIDDSSALNIVLKDTIDATKRDIICGVPPHVALTRRFNIFTSEELKFFIDQIELWYTSKIL